MDKVQGQVQDQDQDQGQERDSGPDNTWRQLVPAVLDGPLSKAGVVAAKVKLERDVCELSQLIFPVNTYMTSRTRMAKRSS